MTEEGRIFDGYKITRFGFARGSVGLVHEAVSPNGKRVAIKVLDRKMIEESVASHSAKTDLTELTRRAYETNIERFKEEYQTIVGLKHINVAEVYKIGFFEDQLYIVSEFIEGKPIAEFVRGWQPVKMVPLFVQVLEGLDFIHINGLIHLDIKSHNVLVSEVEGKPVAKIIDFGMAMKPSEYDGLFMGTPSYIAPEVALGKRELTDRRADLFSYGVLMYYCITWGSMPFARAKSSVEKTRDDIERKLTPDPPSYAHKSRRGYVPEYLDTITMRLLEYQPNDRFYSNARAVINALQTKMPDAFAESLEAKGSYLRPIGDRHIGNESEQALVFAAIDALALGETPSPAVVEITGEQGTGKSHLLKKIKEHAERYAEKLAIKKIELPADETALKRFSDDITLWASENKIPAVVLVDGMGTFPSPPPNDRRAGLRGEGQGEGDLSNTLTGLFRMITNRESKPALYSGQQPLFVAFTSNLNTPSPLVTADGGIAPKALEGEGRGEGGLHLTIPLPPFTLTQLKNYLSSTPAFKNKNVPDKWVAKLHESTEGIQAEVDEHLLKLDSDGLLFGLDGEIVVSTIKRREKAPATTEARLKKTYEKLFPEERRILDLLSVWGLKGITPPPDFKTISRLIPSTLVALHLNNLSAVITRGTYTFTNNYFSSLIYDQLGEKEKMHSHDSIARYLINNDPEQKDAILLHQGFGSNKNLAIKSLVKLAKTTLYEHGRVELAAWLIEHALPLIDERDVKFRSYIMSLLAEIKIYEGNYIEAENNTVGALAALQRTKNKAAGIEIPLQMWRAFGLIGQKRHGEAAEILDDLLKTHEKRKNTTFYPMILNLKAQNFYSRSFTEPAEAIRLLENSCKIYRESKSLEAKIPSQNTRLINSNNLGVVLRVLGKLPEAASELGENLSNKEHTIFSRMANLFALAEAHRMLGENEKAEIFARELLKIASQCGQGEWMMHAHGTLANICHDTDRFDKAIDEDRKYLAASGCIENKEKHRRTSARLFVHMGHCWKEKGDHDMAILHFDAAIEAGAKGFDLMSSHLGMGESHYRKGSLNAAEKHLSEAKTLLAGLPMDASARSHSVRIEKLRGEIANICH